MKIKNSKITANTGHFGEIKEFTGQAKQEIQDTVGALETLNEDCDEYRKISFIVEQLLLIRMEKETWSSVSTTFDNIVVHGECIKMKLLFAFHNFLETADGRQQEDSCIVTGKMFRFLIVRNR